MSFASLADVYADYELLEADDRYRLLIDLGRALEPMPEALKTDATLVRGCSASVWLYPVARDDGRLHFLANSNAAITKGIVALILLAVQDRTPADILAPRHRGRARPLRPLPPAQLQPHPGHSQHDRPDPRKRPAAGGMSGFDPEKFMDYASRASAGHGAAVGVAYHAHGEDWVELSIPWREELVGMPETGVLASGPIISLMDMATSLAVWMKLGKFRPQATLDLRVDYLRPAVPGRSVIGRGSCYRVTHSVAFVRGIAHDGDPDDPVANVTGTFMGTD